MTILELVRHGKAGSRGAWQGDDLARPLDPVGRAQAEAIAERLHEAAGGPVVRPLSSPAARCVQTLEPLGRRTGLAVEVADELAEARPPDGLDGAWAGPAWAAGRALRLVEQVAAAPGRVVLCSHGDVLPALLGLLAGRHRLDPVPAGIAKGAGVTVRLRDGAATAAEPWPPPAIG